MCVPARVYVVFALYSAEFSGRAASGSVRSDLGRSQRHNLFVCVIPLSAESQGRVCSPQPSPQQQLLPSSQPVKQRPEDKMNGTIEGICDHAPHDGSFMFTSESVGEGHPGE